MAKQLKNPLKPNVIKGKVEKTLKSYDDEYVENNDPFWGCKSIPDMIRLLESNKEIGIDAKILCTNGKTLGIKEMNKQEFLEAVKKTSIELNGKKLTESAVHSAFRETIDAFGTDQDLTNQGTVGTDFIPLLGGPFNKQQYYADYIRGHMTAFYNLHHDPIARFCIMTLKDFTLGREYRIDAKGKDAVLAQALWDAVAEVNEFNEFWEQFAIELSCYGECMVWQLPDNDKFFPLKGRNPSDIPKGLLPRFRLIDPSLCWDIVTYPEDIKRALAYQLVGPTQYQIYTQTEKEKVETLRFIYQQVPAEQVDHWKVNVVSNEKRGRSDLYPVLGYLKRLRDSVNWQIIGLQKASAYSLDTSIDGSQSDIDAYADAQAALGTIAPAGSEFIHSTKVTRQYLGVEGRGAPNSNAFEWVGTMIANGFRIPATYLLGHMAGGSTRASAMVATEPVVKHFESRRNVYERAMISVFDRVMKKFGLDATCEVTFPELVVQDRSAKLQDLALCAAEGWFSTKRCAEIAAIEMDVDDYDYDQEKEIIDEDKQQQMELIAPLSQPTKIAGQPVKPGQPNPQTAQPQNKDQGKGLDKAKGVTNNDKRGLNLGRGQ